MPGGAGEGSGTMYANPARMAASSESAVVFIGSPLVRLPRGTGNHFLPGRESNGRSGRSDSNPNLRLSASQGDGTKKSGPFAGPGMNFGDG